MRVAVEAENPSELPQLQRGLRLLSQADPSVRVALADRYELFFCLLHNILCLLTYSLFHVSDSGEFVIVALGELHLEHCLRCLREDFAKIALRCVAHRAAAALRFSPLCSRAAAPLSSPQCALAPSPTRAPAVYALVLVSDRSASPPIISFRETITARGDAVEAATADRHVTLRVRAEPLGAALTEMVAVAVAGAIAAAAEAGDAAARGSGGGGATASFVEALRALPSSDDARAALPADEVWALAPSHAGPCVLRASTEVRSVAAALLVANGLLAGFNAAASAGPMCGEPMHGVAIVVEEIVVAEGAASGAGAGGAGGAESVEARAASSSQHGQSQHGPLSGQIISTSQRACRSAFLAKNSSPRLVEPYYRCKLQCSGEQLGALYGVLARRRGVVIEEDLWEGTPIFSIVSLLPVSRRRALAPGALRLQWLFAISRRLLARALSLVRPLSLSLSLSLCPPLVLGIRAAPRRPPRASVSRASCEKRHREAQPTRSSCLTRSRGASSKSIRTSHRRRRRSERSGGSRCTSSSGRTLRASTSTRCAGARGSRSTPKWSSTLKSSVRGRRGKGVLCPTMMLVLSLSSAHCCASVDVITMSSTVQYVLGGGGPSVFTGPP